MGTMDIVRAGRNVRIRRSQVSKIGRPGAPGERCAQCDEVQLVRDLGEGGLENSPMHVGRFEFAGGQRRQLN